MLKLYKLFKQITEGVKITDSGDYEFNYDADLSDDLIKFSDTLSYKKNEYGDIVIIGIPILKDVKKSKIVNDLKKGMNIPQELVSKITDKIIINITDGIDINNFDYIITPKSSSDLTKEFIEKLKLVAPKPNYVSDLFLKNDTDKIWLDLDKAKSELSNKFFKKLIKDFEKLKNNSNQPLKLQPLTNFQRKYVRDLLKLNPEYDNLIVDMLNKKVFVVDDIVTSGKTLNDIKLMLSSLNTNTVVLFAMFG